LKRIMIKFRPPWEGLPFSFGLSKIESPLNIGPTYRLVGDKWKEIHLSQVEGAFVDLLLDASHEGEEAFSEYSIRKELWGVDVDWEEISMYLTRMEQMGIIVMVPDSEKIITHDQEMPDLSKYDPYGALTRFVKFLSWKGDPSKR